MTEQSKSPKQAKNNKDTQKLRDQAQEDRRYDGDSQETDPLKEQKKSRDKARSEDRKNSRQTPPKIAADSAREAQQLYDDMRAGKFKDLNPANKQRLVKRFEELMEQAGWSPQKRNPLKGNFDEGLRTPKTAPAQPEYKSGGVRVPGEDKAGTVRPDYDQVKPDASGVDRRSHVNLKSDNLEIKSEADALSTARKYTNKAIKDTKVLPPDARVVIRYRSRPVDVFGEHVKLEERMNEIHFKQGSPISEVQYGTVTYRNPNFWPPAPVATSTTPVVASTTDATNATKTGARISVPTPPTKVRVGAQPTLPNLDATTRLEQLQEALEEAFADDAVEKLKKKYQKLP